MIIVLVPPSYHVAGKADIPNIAFTELRDLRASIRAIIG
jgi:hypothetical protein